MRSGVPSRVVVLGGGGFVGRHIAAAFADRSPEVEYVAPSRSEVDLLGRDASRRVADLLSADSVLVVAAAVKKELGDTVDTFESNIAIGTAVCRALEFVPVSKVVYVSSVSVYGDDVADTAIAESTPISPSSYYGIAKCCVEQLILQALGGETERLIVLRPPAIYGPGDTVEAYGPSGFVKAASAGRRITLWGDGTETREFLYVGDLAEIIRRLALSDASGVVNAVSGVSHSYCEVLDAIASALGARPAVESRSRTRPRVDTGYDGGRLQGLLDDFEFTSLADGIRLTVCAEAALSD